MTAAEQTEAAGARFPSPFEVSIPADCEGWEEMYAYHTLFAEDRRAADEARFWFQDGVHGPEPVHPFDCVWWDYGMAACAVTNLLQLRRNPLATERGVKNRHETAREPDSDEPLAASDGCVDTERHEPARVAADMESNKDLK
jgi:hypothetical protein